MRLAAPFRCGEFLRKRRPKAFLKYSFDKLANLDPSDSRMHPCAADRF